MGNEKQNWKKKTDPNDRQRRKQQCLAKLSMHVLTYIFSILVHSSASRLFLAPKHTHMQTYCQKSMLSAEKRGKHLKCTGLLSAFILFLSFSAILVSVVMDTIWQRNVRGRGSGEKEVEIAFSLIY